MKSRTKYFAATAASLFIGMSAITAFGGPSTGAYVPIQTAEEAKGLPKRANIMLACAGCKTIKPVDRKGIEAWFSTKVQHDCAACGGKLMFTGAVPGKSPGAPAEYVHTCSHCGKVSAYLCARH